MGDTGSKKPRSKAPATEDGVLGALPATRPSRMGRRGREGADTVTKATAKPAPRRAVASVSEATPQRPRAVSSAANGLAGPAKKSATRRAPAARKPPSAIGLVTTVVQAAGELVSVSLSVAGQLLKRAVDRLPTP